MKSDHISQVLERRKSMSEMTADGMVKHVSLAPSLHPAASSLEKSILKDGISHLLETRLEPVDMVEKGLLHDTLAPAIQAASRRLSLKMRRDSVGHLLEVRSTPEELLHKNILKAPVEESNAITARLVDFFFFVFLLSTWHHL